MKTRAFSDEDLALYLDGEASETLIQEIEAARLKDTKLSSELDRMRVAQAAFVADQDSFLAAAPPMPGLPAPARSAVPWAPALGGMVAGLVIAAGLAWPFLSKDDPDWRDVVANYQSLYVTETLAGAVEPQSALDAKLVELSGVLGIDLTALPDIDGLDYRRAQQLGYEGAPLAQLTFLTHDGGPVALCILRTSGPDSENIQADTLSGLSAFSWVDNGFGVLLIGPQGDATLPEAATMFRAALRDAAA
ncbi:MAG: hypothetical protein AAFY35_02000 [Pseudomonadota bacterium]